MGEPAIKRVDRGARLRCYSKMEGIRRAEAELVSVDKPRRCSKVKAGYRDKCEARFQESPEP